MNAVTKQLIEPPPGAVILEYPFRGYWRVENSPARRIPSHGTHAFGLTYAIDFVAVDERGRSAPWGLRSMMGTEPPERFVGYGVPIVAPASGIVAAVHDGEPDHEARRSPLSLVPYMLSQRVRAQRGAVGLAGNHIVIAHDHGGPFVLLGHLQRGSIVVRPGQEVRVGQTMGACGNSGNSTEPHVHIQATDSIDWTEARGIPLAFRGESGEALVPGERQIIRA